MLDPIEFGKAMAAIVNDATAPLIKRIEAQEARIAELESLAPVRGEKGDAGPQGEPGRDADPIDVAEVVRELVACEDIRPILSLLVAEYMQAHPAHDGKDGRDGDRGEKGEKGDAGQNGADGVGLAGAMIDRDGTLIITTSKGEAHRLGCVVGKDGAPGRDGIDSIDFDVERTGEREVAIQFVRDGAVVKRKTITLPTMIYRGQWARDKQYQEGDTVSRDGSVWVAKAATDAVPAFENRDYWELAVRKGRDGGVRVAKESSADVKVKQNPESEE